MSETVAVRREELEWLLRVVADHGHCIGCPVDGRFCAGSPPDSCNHYLRAHFLPEEARVSSPLRSLMVVHEAGQATYYLDGQRTTCRSWQELWELAFPQNGGDDDE